MVVSAITSNEEWASKVKGGSGLTVVDFHAVWCGPCKAIAPFVSELSEKYSDVTFVKVDVDELPDVAQEADVTAMPTFAFYKGGEKIAEMVGAKKDRLEELVQQHK